MNVPGNGHNSDDPDGSKWKTIRYAIDRWGTTFRLLLILVIPLVPCYLVIWLTHLSSVMHFVKQLTLKW